MSILVVLVGLVAVVGFWLLISYNQLVSLRNQADEASSGIDVQLKRRFDLVPNLVETVKGYASHEKNTLENVIKARNSGMQATSSGDKAQADGMLTGALKSLFALSEAYPDLKANQNFVELQKSLADVEDNLQNARRYYNAVVRDLNNACQTFPSVLVANAFGFARRAFFETSERERENVKVSFT